MTQIYINKASRDGCWIYRNLFLATRICLYCYNDNPPFVLPVYVHEKERVVVCCFITLIIKLLGSKKNTTDQKCGGVWRSFRIGWGRVATKTTTSVKYTSIAKYADLWKGLHDANKWKIIWSESIDDFLECIGFLPALGKRENLEKWDNFFQSGKSQEILQKNLKSFSKWSPYF